MTSINEIAAAWDAYQTAKATTERLSAEFTRLLAQREPGVSVYAAGKRLGVSQQSLHDRAVHPPNASAWPPPNLRIRRPTCTTCSMPASQCGGHTIAPPDGRRN